MKDNSNPFGNLSTDGLEEARDVLGGGGGVLDSDVYNGTIVHAYSGKSQGGANSLTVRIQFGDRQYNETLYVTNKQGENYYTRDGKKNPLPGFTTVNDLALLSTGYALSDQEFEEKVLSLYDFDAKAEIPKKVMVATGMIGKAISCAIMKNIEDKNQKNEQTGQYEPTGQTRETNTIDKVFHSDSGKTVSEVIGKKDAEFQEKWITKNKGRIYDKSKGVAGTVGAPKGASRPSGTQGAPTAKSKSLFG